MWFRVDDKLHDHRKTRTAGKAAMGVWVLAGSWCAERGNGGFVPANVVTRWGSSRDAARLVDAGLWTDGEKDGERGWWFHDWPHFQLSAEQVQELREKRREAGRKGGVNSGRSRREANQEASASANEKQGRSPVPVPVPVPVPLSVVTYPSQSPTALRALTDEDWQKIERATKGPRLHAIAVATHILDRAASDVANPRRYILRAIANDPELHKFNRGNPTKDTECREHAGEWGDACRQCALEHRLGDLA